MTQEIKVGDVFVRTNSLDWVNGYTQICTVVRVTKSFVYMESDLGHKYKMNKQLTDLPREKFSTVSYEIKN